MNSITKLFQMFELLRQAQCYVVCELSYTKNSDWAAIIVNKNCGIYSKVLWIECQDSPAKAAMKAVRALGPVVLNYNNPDYHRRLQDIKLLVLKAFNEGLTDEQKRQRGDFNQRCCSHDNGRDFTVAFTDFQATFTQEMSDEDIVAKARRMFHLDQQP